AEQGCVLDPGQQVSLGSVTRGGAKGTFRHALTGRVERLVLTGAPNLVGEALEVKIQGPRGPVNDPITGAAARSQQGGESRERQVRSSGKAAVVMLRPDNGDDRPVATYRTDGLLHRITR